MALYGKDGIKVRIYNKNNTYLDLYTVDSFKKYKELSIGKKVELLESEIKIYYVKIQSKLVNTGTYFLYECYLSKREISSYFYNGNYTVLISKHGLLREVDIDDLQ